MSLSGQNFKTQIEALLEGIDAPPCRMGRRGSGQSSLATSDNLVLTMLDYIQELNRQYLQDAEAERAHQPRWWFSFILCT